MLDKIRTFLCSIGVHLFWREKERKDSLVHIVCSWCGSTMWVNEKLL